MTFRSWATSFFIARFPYICLPAYFIILFFLQLNRILLCATFPLYFICWRAFRLSPLLNCCGSTSKEHKCIVGYGVLGEYAKEQYMKRSIFASFENSPQDFYSNCISFQLHQQWMKRFCCHFCCFCFFLRHQEYLLVFWDTQSTTILLRNKTPLLNFHNYDLITFLMFLSPHLHSLWI